MADLYNNGYLFIEYVPERYNTALIMRSWEAQCAHHVWRKVVFGCPESHSESLRYWVLLLYVSKSPGRRH